MAQACQEYTLETVLQSQLRDASNVFLILSSSLNFGVWNPLVLFSNWYGCFANPPYTRVPGISGANEREINYICFKIYAPTVEFEKSLLVKPKFNRTEKGHRERRL